jgi:anaerobic ribonucleoside-triphosphate reductase activating protein
MYYSAIYKYDTINSRGFSVSVFISGCQHYCPGCFNPETWNFKFGQEFTYETIDEIIEALSPPYISSFCLIGGDPLESSVDPMLEKLLKTVRDAFCDTKKIWIWSGHTFQEILNDPIKLKIIKYCDVLIDGRFIKKLMDLNLPHRGSKNQNVILIQESLRHGEVKLLPHT